LGLPAFIQCPVFKLSGCSLSKGLSLRKEIIGGIALITSHLVDDTDRRLIALLQADGRRSNSGLADALRVSAVTVKNRIHRLAKSGLIANTVYVDPTRAGAPLGVVIGLRVAERDLGEAVTALAEKEYILRVTRATGLYNLLAPAYFRSLNAMSLGLLDILTTLKGVRNSETFVILQDHDSGNEPAHILDEYDRRLVEALVPDGRQSFAVLARRVGMTASTVRRRVEALLEAGLIKFGTSVNEQKASWFCRGAVVLRVDPGRLLEVVKKARAHPSVRFATAVTGSWDVFVSIVGDSHSQLRTIADEELRGIEGVRDFSLFISEGTVNGGMWATRKYSPAAAKGNKARVTPGHKTKRRN
jgi:DNA-binding Lrp family transcriptional regulator